LMATLLAAVKSPTLHSGRSRRRLILTQAGEGARAAGVGTGPERGRTAARKGTDPFDQPPLSLIRPTPIQRNARAARRAASPWPGRGVGVGRGGARAWRERRWGLQQPRGSVSRFALAWCLPAQSLSGRLIRFLAFHAFFCLAQLRARAAAPWHFSQHAPGRQVRSFRHGSAGVRRDDTQQRLQLA
jgi:hypothetical protein